ncbi:MAG TPA: DUF3256 family protein [Paludibacter sp.]|nr:DUF3256 family protein [Paludibacter sp.]
MNALKIKTLAILLLYVTLANAQNIDSLFVNMPDNINPVLNKMNRKEMLSNVKLLRNDSTLNVFMKYSKLLKYDSLENHIRIRNSALSTFEMKKFRTENGVELIGVIRTFGDTIKSSNITFYNTNWTVNQLQFQMPEASNWLDKNGLSNSTLDITWAENQLLTSFIALNFIDKGLKIEAKNNTYYYLSDETKKTLKPFLTDKIMKYVYADKKWVKADE